MVDLIVKKDIYGNQERWLKWKNTNTKTIEGLSPYNSKVLLDFLADLESGQNMPAKAKGKRTSTTLINNRDHVMFFLKLLKNKRIIDLSKEEIHAIEQRVIDGKIKKLNGSKFTAFGNYIKDFKNFWHWLLRTKRVNEDICIDLCRKINQKPSWTYLTEEQFKQMANAANSDYRVLIWFFYDAGLRITEGYSLKVKNFDKDYTELTIPTEVSKTFGRVIKIKLCSTLIKEYIKLHNLQPDDFLIIKKPAAFNKYLGEHCQKLFGDGETKARGKYGEFSIYSIRHNAACYWMKRYPNLKGLKYRMGWKREEMATYYHEFLGMSDEISDDDMITQEDKTKLQKMEKEYENLKKKVEVMGEFMLQHYEKDINEIMDKTSIEIKNKGITQTQKDFINDIRNGK